MKTKRYWLRGGIIFVILGIGMGFLFSYFGEVCNEIGWAVDLHKTQSPDLLYHSCKLMEYITFPLILSFYAVLIISSVFEVAPLVIQEVLFYIALALLFFIEGAILGFIYAGLKKLYTTIKNRIQGI